jgi:hypothetical protein
MAAHHANDSLDMIVNCDETAWRIIPSDLLTWAPVGRDGVLLWLDGKEKDSVTILASATATGTKLPLFGIANETTKKVERPQLGSDQALIRDHSESGSNMTEIFQRYLDWLHDHFCSHCLRPLSAENPVELILDCYAVHRSVETMQYAAERFIRLSFSPAGHTDGLRPLDRAVFGDITAIFRRRFEVVRRESWNQRVTKVTATNILADVWKNLEPKSICRGWATYEDDFGPEDEEEEGQK